MNNQPFASPFFPNIRRNISYPFPIIHHSSFIIHFSFFIFHFSFFIIHFSFFIFHFSSFIIHFSFFIIHFSFFIIHFSFFIFHFSLFFTLPAWCSNPRSTLFPRHNRPEDGASARHNPLRGRQTQGRQHMRILSLLPRKPGIHRTFLCRQS